MLKFYKIFFILQIIFSIKVSAQSRCETLFFSQNRGKTFLTDQSWGLQIFEREFEKIGQFFIDNRRQSDNEKVAAFMKADMRKSFFKIQSLSRIFDSQNKNFFQEHRLLFKSWEDAAGKMDLARSLRKMAESLGNQKIIDYFLVRENDYRQKFIETMRQSGFWEEPEQAIAQLKSIFKEKGKWKKVDDEKTFLIKVISDNAMQLHKDITKSLFDDPDIEKGLHEIRRRLRWILIQVISLDGVISTKTEGALGAKIKKTYARTNSVRPNILESKYIKATEPLVDNPIEVPLIKMALLADLVAEIGERKDKAEMQIYIHEAALEVGLLDPEINLLMSILNNILETEPVDHQKISREIQQELADNKLLKEFSKHLNN